MITVSYEDFIKNPKRYFDCAYNGFDVIVTDSLYGDEFKITLQARATKYLRKNNYHCKEALEVLENLL